MKYKDLKGRVKYKNISHTLVKWNEVSKSKFQREIKDFFRKYWEYDLVYEEMPMVGTRLRLDLANYTKKVAVEVQGEQHNEFNTFFHKTRNDFRRQLERDDKKEKWCEVNGYKLILIFQRDRKLLSKQWILDEFGINL
jgi:hypothetical protein